MLDGSPSATPVVTNCGGAGGGPAAATPASAISSHAAISVEKRYMYPSARGYCHGAGSAAAPWNC